MRQRGFTYLGMLFFVAITAAALAALGQRWSTAVQREKERELEFRGQEIARAIASYLKAGAARPGAPGGAHPRSLEELLVDERGPKARHHLRRAYVDPFTGKPDWVLLPAPTDPQGFRAVHSRSEQELMRRLPPDESVPVRAMDWVFSADQAGPDAA
ncbi:MAG TPA: type II secretion system protein, partial [Roseateles sp.]|nr:type II secretion system protein [Roseateles sp.]